LIDYRLKSVIKGYGDIFFIDHLLASIVVLVCTFINPNIGLCGAIAVIAAYGFTRLIRAPRTLLLSKPQVVNALLIGFSIGSLFKLNWVTAGFIVATSVLSVIVTMSLESVSATYLGLPVFSLPFVAVSSVIYLAAPRYSNLMVNSLYQAPYWIKDVISNPILAGYFKSLGSIIFMPQVIPGVVLATLIILNSRLLFGLGFLGYVWGILVQGYFIGNLHQAMVESVGFNYILIAMAIGGVFLVPTVESLFIALLSVTASTLLISAAHTFWAQYGLPVFTLPFIIVTAQMVYILRLVRYPGQPIVTLSTPEATQEYASVSKLRYETAVSGYTHGTGQDVSLAHYPPFYPGMSMIFDATVNGNPAGTVSLLVGQSPNGLFYLSRGTAQLYFGMDRQWMVIYHMEGWDPYLATIYLAWPKMPTVAPIGTQWDDYLYSAALISNRLRWICKNAHWALPGACQIKGTYSLHSPTDIVGCVKNPFLGILYDTHIQFDGLSVRSIRAGQIILQKKDVLQ